MIWLRVVIGLMSLLGGALWCLLILWARGMAGFGNPSRSVWDSVLELLPLVTCVLILLSVFVIRRWLFPIVALFVAPCLLFSLYMALENPVLGLPLAGYYGLWIVYFCLAWQQHNLRFDIRP